MLVGERIEASPSWPRLLAPQQSTAPLDSSAQLLYCPASNFTATPPVCARGGRKSAALRLGGIRSGIGQSCRSFTGYRYGRKSMTTIFV